MPSEPVSIAAQSDSRSPNRLSVTMTSNCLGWRTSCMAQLSAYMWLERDVRVLAVVQLLHRLAPQHAGLHDVGLLDRGDRCRACRASSKPTRAIALDLGRGVDLGVDAAPRAVGQVLDAARLAEIDAAGELAQDHDVQARDQLGLQATRPRPAPGRRWPGAGWRTGPAPCAGAAGRARASSRTAGCPISARRPRRTSPCRWPAPSPWWRRPAARHARRRRHRRPGPPRRRMPSPRRAEPADDAPDLAHDLGADAVAGEEKDGSDLGHEAAPHARCWVRLVGPAPVQAAGRVGKLRQGGGAGRGGRGRGSGCVSARGGRSGTEDRGPRGRPWRALGGRHSRRAVAGTGLC